MKEDLEEGNWKGGYWRVMVGDRGGNKSLKGMRLLIPNLFLSFVSVSLSLLLDNSLRNGIRNRDLGFPFSLVFLAQCLYCCLPPSLFLFAIFILIIFYLSYLFILLIFDLHTTRSNSYILEYSMYMLTLFYPQCLCQS